MNELKRRNIEHKRRAPCFSPLCLLQFQARMLLLAFAGPRPLELLPLPRRAGYPWPRASLVPVASLGFHSIDRGQRAWPSPHRTVGRLTLSPQASSSSAAVPAPAPQSTLEHLAEVLTMLFPVWALMSGALAFYHPSSLSWLSGRRFEVGVQLLMLAMGLSLSTEDFKKCAANPVPILLGFVCQYSILPVLAVVISRLLNLGPEFSVGLILLGCCPGGQASNVATFVARGDVPLSILMTTASTLGASIATPALASILAGAIIPVNAWDLAKSTVALVLVPTLLGVAANELFHRQIDSVRPVLPLLALALTVVLCAVPVASVADVLRTSGMGALLPVVMLHSFGYLLGYLLPRLLGFSEKVSRTVSIETGMQSAAMGFALATHHFSNVLVAVPSAISIVVMVWVGAVLASIWRLMPIKGEETASAQ